MINKKYTHGNINLYNCDCMDFMLSVPDYFYDLAIVDPPYNIASLNKTGASSRIDKSGKINNWNNKKPDDLYFKELFRVSKNQIIWGANNYTGLPATEYFCIWNKEQSVDNFASLEYAWVSKGIGVPAKMFTYSIHKHNSSKGDKIHPTMKPVALYKWLLEKYSDSGFKILDTFLGSASIAIACHDYGFYLDGCELDVDYFDSSIKRVKNHVSQTKIFFNAD